MSRSDHGWRKFQAVGHRDEVLWFIPSASCGDVDDGVAFAHGDEGGWVISFDDLKRAFLEAERVRKDGGAET